MNYYYKLRNFLITLYYESIKCAGIMEISDTFLVILMTKEFWNRILHKTKSICSLSDLFFLH